MSFWAQVFPDKPISETRLREMRAGIMQDIMASPQNFVEELELKRRRRFGFLLMGLVMASGVGIVLLIWLAGGQLWLFLQDMLLMTTGYLHLSWLDEVWSRIGQIVHQLTRLRAAGTAVLNAYTVPLLVLSIAWLLVWTEMRSISSED